MKSPSCVHSESVHCLLFGRWIFRNLHKQEVGRTWQTARKVLLFSRTAWQPQWSVKGCLMAEFVFKGCTVCVRALSAWYQRLVFLLINIILEPQISIITSVIMIAFPLIISVTLHTGLWKLAPYFKEKRKKKFVTRLYVKKEL